jgi:hypothetical protein
MEPIDAIDPAAMSEDQLRAEVWYWREAASHQLWNLVQALKDAVPDSSAARRLAEQAREIASALEDALTGDGLDKCALCGDVLVPGMAALREVTEGDVHAECLGELTEGEGKPGDSYQLDPEGVVDENDEPTPDGDGVLIAHAYRPARTTEDMVALLASARDAGARFVNADAAEG